MDLFDLAAKITLDSSDYDKGLDEAESKGVKLGQALKGALTNGAKVAAAAVATVGAGALAVGKMFVSATDDVAGYGDEIDKASQKIGFSTDAYQEWDAVLQHSGTSMSAAQASIKALTNAVKSGSDAFEKIGISQEKAASMSREELWAATIEGLQNVADETERARLAQELLGRGAMEMGALLNTSAEDTKAMRDRVHELGGVMSNEAVKAAANYKDKLQDLKTAFGGLRTNLVSEFLPALSDVMDGLTDIFAGDQEGGLGKISAGIESLVSGLSEKIPRFMEVGGDILLAIGRAITQNLPKLAGSASEIVLTLISELVNALPGLLSTGGDIILSLVSGITAALPDLIPAAVSAITTIALNLTDPAQIGQVVDAAIALVTALGTGLIDALPILIENVPQIVINLATAIGENAGKIVEGAADLIIALATALTDPENLETLVEKGPEIVVALLEAIVTAAVKLLEAGAKLLEKLGEGIDNAIDKVFEKGEEIVGELIDGIKAHWEDIVNLGKSFLDGFISGLLGIPTAPYNAGQQLAEQAQKGIINGDKSEGLGADTVLNYAKGIADKVPAVLNPSKTIAETVIAQIKNGGASASSAKVWGSDLVDSYAGGISSTSSFQKIANAASGIAQKVKNILGFSEPSEGPLSNFHTYAPDMIDLFAQGVRENSDKLQKEVASAFDFRDSIEAPQMPETDILDRQTPAGSPAAGNDIISRIVSAIEALKDGIQVTVVLDDGTIIQRIDTGLGTIAQRKARGN